MDQPQNRNLPRVIFLDAVGTLFGIKGSVGQAYGNIARQFGVEVSPQVLDRAFYRSFKAAGMPAFAITDPTEIQAREFAWWMGIATQTFKQAGAFQKFPDFSTFFSELYAYFATAQPWFIYADVVPALRRWQQLGVQMGILSNFDSRLYAVLEALDLAQYFSSITISTEVGAAKPDSRIFQIALQKYNCAAADAWHIGDHYDEDYQAARAVGMRGIWLHRREAGVG
jgi:putative hydrolase of the HAD superfamily